MNLTRSPHPAKLNIRFLNILIKPFRNSPEINLLILIIHKRNQSLLSFRFTLKLLIGRIQEQLVQLLDLHGNL